MGKDVQVQIFFHEWGFVRIYLGKFLDARHILWRKILPMTYIMFPALSHYDLFTRQHRQQFWNSVPHTCRNSKAITGICIYIYNPMYLPLYLLFFTFYHRCYSIGKRCTRIITSQFCITKLNCPTGYDFFFGKSTLLTVRVFTSVLRGFDCYMSKSHAMAKNSGTLHRYRCPCRTSFHPRGCRGKGQNVKYIYMVTAVTGSFQKHCLVED